MKISNDKFILAILEAPIPMMIIAEDGEIMGVSQSWSDLTGYSREELRTLQDWIDRGYANRKVEMSEFINNLFSVTHRLHQGEFEVITRDGRTLIWEFSSTPLGTLEDGRRLILSVAADETRRIELSNAVARSEKQFRDLFIQSPDAIFIESMDGIVLDVNPAACSLHEATREQLLGKPVSELVPPDERENASAEFEKLARGETRRAEGFSFSTSKRKIPVDLHVSRIDFNGNPALLLIVRDITERKQAEQAIRDLNASLELRVAERTRELEEANIQLQDLDAMKTAFIAVTSHEIRAPLSILNGMLNLMEIEYRGDKRASVFLRSARRATDRLLTLSTRMNVMLHAGSYEDQPDLQPVYVKSILNTVAENVTPFIEKRHQTLTVNHIPEPVKITVDRGRIEDVLNSLAMNAIKFTPDEGAITITALEERDAILFEVADTGIGIPPEDQPHIFREFFTTLDPSHHSSGEFEFEKRGVGLGLNIARKFVELHGGKIFFQTSPLGTTFRVRIPTEPPEKTDS